MDSNAILALPGVGITLDILNGATDSGVPTVSVNCAANHRAVGAQTADDGTLLHGDGAALQPHGAGWAKAAGRTLVAIGHRIVDDLASTLHDKLATGQAHGAHSAIIFKHGALTERNSANTVIGGNHSVLHDVCVRNLVLSDSRMAVAFGISLNEVFTLMNPAIIKDDVGQGKGGSTRTRRAVNLDHGRIVRRARSILLLRKVLATRKRKRPSLSACDSKVLTIIPGRFRHRKIAHHINGCTVFRYIDGFC